MAAIFFYSHIVIMVSIVWKEKNMKYQKNAKIHQSVYDIAIAKSRKSKGVNNNINDGCTLLRCAGLPGFSYCII